MNRDLPSGSKQQKRAGYGRDRDLTRLQFKRIRSGYERAKTLCDNNKVVLADMSRDIGYYYSEGWRDSDATTEIMIQGKLDGVDIPQPVSLRDYVIRESDDYSSYETYGEDHSMLRESRSPSNAKSRQWDRTIAFLRIFNGNERAARLIIEQGIDGFHGSNSSTLVSVLEQGLLAEDELGRRGISTLSGERTRYARDNSGDSTKGGVSFADWQDIAHLRRYSGIYRKESPDHECTFSYSTVTNRRLRNIRSLNRIDENWYRKGCFENEDGRFGNLPATGIESLDNITLAFASLEILLHKARILKIPNYDLKMESFPVLYGISIREFLPHSEFEDAINSETCESIHLDGERRVIAVTNNNSAVNSEVRVKKPVRPSDIKMIAVPQDKIERVEALVRQFGVGASIVPVEAILCNN